MSPTSIKKVLDNTEASINMEGLYVSQTCKELCEKLLNNEITFEQYLEQIIEDTYDCNNTSICGCI